MARQPQVTPSEGPGVDGAPDAAPREVAGPRRLEVDALDALLDALVAEGFAPIGPRVREGAIVYEPIRHAADLPRGVSDEQDAGRYRLTTPGHDAFFGFAVGPHSWKRELFPARLRTWTAHKLDEAGIAFAPEPADQTRRAFVGVRACEIAAIAIQDRVFTGGPYHDADYASRRRDIAIIAVQCTRPARTCFCASMHTGPRATAGFDLALTEVERDGSDHFFIVEVGSALGARLMSRVPSHEASTFDIEAAEGRLRRAERGMGRAIDTQGLPALLARSHDAPRWQAVAERCLSCTNCTMACPTCFCSSVDDVPSLDGDRAERWRRWDSCFNADFSYIHGGAVRRTPASRYRQWLTHKLGNWWEQFGTSGCVGCGRCITWCPVGIDLTEEVAALQLHDDDTSRRATGAGEEG